MICAPMVYAQRRSLTVAVVNGGRLIINNNSLEAVQKVLTLELQYLVNTMFTIEYILKKKEFLLVWWYWNSCLIILKITSFRQVALLQKYLQGGREISAIILTDDYLRCKEPRSAYNFFLILIFNELLKFKTSDEWQRWKMGRSSLHCKDINLYLT